MPEQDYTEACGQIFGYFAAALRAHALWMRDAGMLGPEPSDSVLKSCLFEVGCAYLYLLDHELRKGRRDDPVLNDLWREVAGWIAGAYEDAYTPEQMNTIMSWRLGRFEDVTRNVEQDDTYGCYADTKIEDYFYLMAQQLVLAVSADANIPDEGGLYPAIVDEGLGARNREFLDVVTSVQDSFLEYALPLYFAARLWSAGTPAYEKTVDELDELAGAAAEEAESLVSRRRESRLELWASGRWHTWHAEGRRFRRCAARVARATAAGELESGHTGIASDVSDVESDSTGDEEIFEHGTNGEPYRRLIEDSNGGVPLRWLLLQAYDDGVGLVATEPERERDAHLSLGRVQTLLQTGSPFETGGDTAVDMDNPEDLVVRPPSPWELSPVSRRFVQQMLLRDGCEEPALSLIEDDSGRRMIVFAPVADKVLLESIRWGIPPGILLGGEAEPRLARFGLYEVEDESEGQPLTAPPPEYPDEAWRTRINEDNVLFRVMPTIRYGPVGEPYQILEIVDGGEDGADDASGVSGGRSLLDLALPCYDLCYGMLLYDRGADGFLWSITIGEVIQFLREGALLPAPMGDHEDMRRRSMPAPGETMRRLDYLTLPWAVQKSLGWSMVRAGITSPFACAIGTVTGETLVAFAYEDELRPEWQRWLNGRISWYLPPGTLNWVFPLELAANLRQFPLPTS